MKYIIPNFFVSDFGENFMKIQTKITKVQIHENLHENMQISLVLWRAIIATKCYSFIQLISI